MVLDRVLAAAGHDHDALDAGVARLLDDVLHERPIDERQHLLGLRLGGRQEPRSQAGGGEHRDADLLHREIVAERPKAPVDPPGRYNGASMSNGGTIRPRFRAGARSFAPPC